jgi:hypothetical protein
MANKIIQSVLVCGIPRPTRYQANIQCNCSAYGVPPDAGLQKKPLFRTNCSDQTWATCVARSGANRSAIHYNSVALLACVYANGALLAFCLLPIVFCKNNVISNWNAFGKTFVKYCKTPKKNDKFQQNNTYIYLGDA